MANTEEIQEQKEMIDRVAGFLAEELSLSESETAWVLLDALATFQLKLVRHDENMAGHMFVTGIAAKLLDN